MACKPTPPKPAFKVQEWLDLVGVASSGASSSSSWAYSGAEPVEADSGCCCLLFDVHSSLALVVPLQSLAVPPIQDQARKVTRKKGSADEGRRVLAVLATVKGYSFTYLPVGLNCFELQDMCIELPHLPGATTRTRRTPRRTAFLDLTWCPPPRRQ